MATFDRIARAAAPRRARARVAVLAAAMSVVALGCSDEDSPTPSPTTTSETASSTPTPEATSTPPEATNTPLEPTSTTSPTPSSEQSVEDEVIARYIAYWDARFAANSDTPNPDDPALREYATGDQLEAVIAETQANLDQGLAFRRAENPAEVQRVEVVEIDRDHAVVQECVVSDGVIIRRDTGEVVNDEVATHNVRGELLRVDGAWRVSAAELIQRWEGVAGCALAP